MPLGRRYFEPEALKVPLADEFAKAEMAAAVEAVEAAEVVDDVDMTAPEGRPTRGDTDNTAETLEAIEATEADESVAMRIALISDAAMPDAAERVDDASGDPEAMEATLAEAGEATAMRIALLKGAAGLGAAEGGVEADEAAQEAIDEFEAAEFLAGHQAAQEGRAALAAVEAARLKWEVIPEVAAAPPRRYARADDVEASEDVAEALEVGLGNQDGPKADASRGEVPYESEALSRAPLKKKGLFHRFRGK